MFIEDKANGETPSREGFARFLETKNPNETYNWADSCNCACAQYLKSIEKFAPDWLHNPIGVMHGLNIVAAGRPPADIFGNYDPANWTFGKCLDRVKELA